MRSAYRWCGSYVLVLIGLGKERALKVFVRENNIDQALRVLKKKLLREGFFRELKRRKAYRPREERGRKARQFAGEERPRGSSLNAKV